MASTQDTAACRPPRTVWAFLLDYFFAIDVADHSLDVTVVAYADFLRSQALALPRGSRRDQYNAMICAAEHKGYAGFSELMAIETRLTLPVYHGATDDLNLQRSYWVICDRFARVASAQARQGYADWAPKELLVPAVSPATTLAAAFDDEKSAATELGIVRARIDAAKAAMTAAPHDAALAATLAEAERDQDEIAAHLAAAASRRHAAELTAARTVETDALIALGRAVAAEANLATQAGSTPTAEQAKAVDTAKQAVADAKAVATAASAEVTRLAAGQGAA